MKSDISSPQTIAVVVMELHTYQHGNHNICGLVTVVTDTCDDLKAKQSSVLVWMYGAIAIATYWKHIFVYLFTLTLVLVCMSAVQGQGSTYGAYQLYFYALECQYLRANIA